jgi:hypothetical protein
MAVNAQKLLAIQNAQRLSFSGRGYRVGAVHFTGLTKRMAKLGYTVSKAIKMRPVGDSVSSMSRGRHFDACCKHYFNCKNTCICPKKAQSIPHAMRRYLDDIKKLKITPLLSQLICVHYKKKIITAADEAASTAGELVIIERKTGNIGNIDYTPVKNQHLVDKVPNSIRGEHMLQLALTCRMAEETYKMKVTKALLVYVDREEKNSTFLSPDRIKDKDLSLEWIPVHEQPWYRQVATGLL